MEERKNMKEEISWADVSKMYREIFPKRHPKDRKLIHVIYHNELSGRGDVHRTIEICLESNIESFKEYEWRILFPKSQQNKVYGLSVHDARGGILEYEITYHKKTNNTPNYALIKIFLPPLDKKRRITIHLEYFVENYADLIKRGIFNKLWKYAWSYRVFSESQKLEHRVILPPRCKIVKNGVISNMSNPPLYFTYGEKEMTIWAEDKPLSSGEDLCGEVTYNQESRTGPLIISLGSSVSVSAVINLIATKLSLSEVVGVFLVSFVGILGALYFAKKFLPTYQ